MSFFVLENPTPREGKMKYVHRDADGGFGYTRTYCWHLSRARKWKTRRGVERWLAAHSYGFQDFVIMEIAG
jgi:hypothetical protein